MVLTVGQIILVATIPIVNGLVGWMTNVVAVIMTFYPIEFIGCMKPYLGWQGIIPSKAEKMAGKAVDLMTTKLIKMDEVIQRLDPIRVSQELAPYFQATMEGVVNEVGMIYAPNTWLLIPAHIKQEIVLKVNEDCPKIIQNFFQDINKNITKVFDLKRMVVNAMVRDKRMMCDIFLKVGEKEFKFIKISGLYFGFLFGLIMMTIYIFYQGYWVLPVAGFMVGYVTNWIALKLIFEPIDPVDLGCYKLQGLFLKRQNEVASEYAKIVTQEILSSKNILQELVRGPSSDELVDILYRHVRSACDDQAGVYTPLIQIAIGVDTYSKIKDVIADRIFQNLPEVITHLEPYADEALDLENTLREKLQQLSSLEFEELLHPIFKEDEIILILVGGFLGLIVGLIQALAQWLME